MENMSGGVYTTRVATLVDDGVNFQLDDYPIFAEGYRRFLNNKIIEHYMFYEIGYETVSLFNFALGRKMREIMPYYNQRYKSCMIEFEALSTQDATTTLDTTTHGTSSDTSHGTRSGTSSDTRDTSGTSSDTHDTTTHESDTRDTTTHDDGTSSDTTTGTSDGTSTNDEATSSDGNTSNEGTSKSRQVDSQFPQAALSGNGDYATSSSDVIGEQTASATSHATADKHETGSTHESTSSTSQGTTSSDGRSHEAGVSDATTRETGSGATSSHEAGSGRTSGEESSTGSGIRDEHGETLQRLTGYSGVAASDLIAKYRETFLNIDMEIIYELRVLFMNIWDSGDNFERSTGYGFFSSYGFPRP